MTDESMCEENDDSNSSALREFKSKLRRPTFIESPAKINRATLEESKEEVKSGCHLGTDEIDKEFATFINKAQLPFKVRKVRKNEQYGFIEYLFGTRKVIAQMINGRLLIRVGGGYMYVEKFIEQYGKFEIKKMQKLGLL